MSGEIYYGKKTGARWFPKNTDYSNLRRSLDVDFRDIEKDTLTKEQLFNLMNTFGYHRTRDKELSEEYGQRVTKKIPVTENQTIYAWNYLKGSGKTKQTILNFTEDRYGYRANTNLFFKGKTYRKGQFIPRSVKYGY